jgi:hypothetical protein
MCNHFSKDTPGELDSKANKEQGSDADHVPDKQKVSSLTALELAPPPPNISVVFS